jgi:hypothetical protein
VGCRIPSPRYIRADGGSTGDTAGAAAVLEHALQLEPADRNGTIQAMQALVLATAGERERAEAKIREAASGSRESIHYHHTAYTIGSAYALLGQPDSAMVWLRSAAAGGLACYPLFAADPALDPLRGNAAFMDLLAGLRLEWDRYRREFG